MKKNNTINNLIEIIKSSRPISWLNTSVPFLIGYLIATHQFDLTALLGFLYFLFPYNILLYGINDIFDYESDVKNPRKGSYQGGIVPKVFQKKIWWAIVLSNFLFVIYFMSVSSNSGRLIFAILLLTCFSYSAKPLRFKELPILDSFNSALHFVLPLLFGLSFDIYKTEYTAAIVAFLCWGMASQAFGSIQDIIPDRKAKINSIATYLGSKRTTRFSIILYIISAILIAVFYFPFGMLISFLLCIYILNVSFFIKYRSDAQSEKFTRGWNNFLWLNLIIGFFIVQTLLILFDPFLVKQYYSLIFGFFLLCFFLLQLALTIYNLKSFSRPRTKKLSEWPKISIILHAYNQADNISSTILSVLGQQYPQFEVIFTDLGSSDNTLKIVNSFQDPRLKTIETPPIKKGWTLNAWVSQHLLKKCTGDIVILISSDTILLPNALSILISLIKNKQLSMVSVLPADQNKSLSQQVILSQNHYFMLGLYPSAILTKYFPSSVNVSGNIIAFNRSSISALGGFELVAKSPLEDFDLSAAVRQKGLKTGFYLGSDIAISQNHYNLRRIISQNLKRYYPALHFSMPLSISMVLFGFLVLIFPSILLFYLLISGSYIGVLMISIAIGLSYINRSIITISSRQSILSVLLYPLGSSICLFLLIYSMLNYEIYKPRWQIRTEAF